MYEKMRYDKMEQTLEKQILEGQNSNVSKHIIYDFIWSALQLHKNWTALNSNRIGNPFALNPSIDLFLSMISYDVRM